MVNANDPWVTVMLFSEILFILKLFHCLCLLHTMTSVSCSGRAFCLFSVIHLFLKTDWSMAAQSISSYISCVLCIVHDYFFIFYMNFHIFNSPFFQRYSHHWGQKKPEVNMPSSEMNGCGNHYKKKVWITLVKWNFIWCIDSVSRYNTWQNIVALEIRMYVGVCLPDKWMIVNPKEGFL